MLLFSLSVKGQLTADFTGAPLQGCAPLVVQFTDVSTGAPTSWFWDLGNGNTSVSQNPGTIYFLPGLYTVKLIVQNASGIDSVVKTDYITVSDKPLINFTSNDTFGCPPLPVQFTDNSSPGSGTITQWQWDFGDGNVSTQPSPSNTFIAAGSYDITLKVSNSGGCSAVFTRPAYITITASPAAAFTTPSGNRCSPPVTVNFSNTSSGAGIVSYNWNFGDGTTSTSFSPSHIFTSAGVFNTTLIVINQAGCADTVSKLISIGAVTPDFDAPDTACVNEGFAVLNTSTPSSISAFWSFGDGSTSNLANPVKKYTATGSYVIKLVNNFGACTDSISKNIEVITGPVANFNFNAPAAGCSIPITVSFTSISTGAVSYLWNFGDGNTSTLSNPIHVYNTRGVYSVTLTVMNAAGCSDSITKPNIISITNPDITSINGLPYKGCTPYTNTFTPAINSPEAVTGYLWNFGDNTTSVLPSPTHTYSISGTFDVSLVITTINGCTDTLKLTSAVMIGDRPSANFTALPLISCAYEKVQFTNTSTGTTTAWLWSFGDSSHSSLENPLHHYLDTGFFTVIFIAENNGCRDSIVKQNYIYIKPPVSFFKTINYCDTPFLKRFIDRSKGAVTYLWDFGDGASSVIKNPIHTYASPGMYLVKLRVDNLPCYDEFTDTVYVVNEQPVINVSSTITCKSTPVNISATVSNASNVVQYIWDFGDATPLITTSISQVIHVYNTPGIYTIILKIKDRLGCVKTVTHANAVNVYGPIAKLSYPPGACVNNPLTFTDQSIPFPNFPIVSWTIDYGDGTVVNTAIPAFTHTYAATGTYGIIFIVKDSYGCSDTLTDTAKVTITKAIADFRVTDSIACRQSLVKFTNTSSGAVFFLWNFGDGTTSNLRNPSHIYTTDGTYTVTLTIRDRFGCADSISKGNLVHISNATAAFTLSDSILNCPPAQVSFTNNSTLYSSLKWFFDDGSSSVLANPVHYYLNGGIYNVKLVVYGFGSCTDSAIRQVKVRGPVGTITYSPIAHCVPATVNFNGSASNITGKFIWDFGDGTTVISTGTMISHTYVNVGRYIPKLLLQDTTISCSVSVFGADTINVSGAMAYIKYSPNIFCDSASIGFFDSSIIQYDTVSAYKWTFGDGTISAAQNPVHTFTTPGLYTVTMSFITQSGCKDTAAPVTIKVVKSPAITLAGSLSSCINDSLTFSLSLALPDTSATQYQWSFGNGNVSTFQNPPKQTYSAAGNFILTVVAINSTGCTDTATKQLIINPSPAISAGPDSIICRGQSLILNPSGGLTYVWQADATLSCSTCSNPVASPLDSMQYVVKGTSLNGCTGIDSVNVFVVQPFSILVSLRDTICRGQTIPLNAAGADTYTWFPSTGLSNINIANPSASPDTTTIYQVIGRDYRNCFADTAYVPVIVFAVPQFNIIPDVISVIAGTTVTLTTTGSTDILSYNWTPSTGLSCTNCPQPQASPQVNTTYTAVVTNAGGCIAKDNVTINLLCGNGNVFIPNTFSPNGDGANDIFYPRGKGVSGVRNFIIYNRWGAIVFERSNFNINDETAGWNGTFKGQPASSDVYVYHLEVLCANGEKFLYKGDVTLIR